MTRLNLIWAQARNGVIGHNGALPWHLPEDLAHFKRTTLGCPVIMGRKTWDSLPARFRPLPGRLNLVLTRAPGASCPGAQCAASLQEALAQCGGVPDVWVIGGADVYAQALPLAQRAVVTEIDASFPGDAHAPQFGLGWTEATRQDQLSATGLKLSFVTYIKP